MGSVSIFVLLCFGFISVYIKYFIHGSDYAACSSQACFFDMNMLVAGLENPELTEIVNSQQHDTSYSGSVMISDAR